VVGSLGEDVPREGDVIAGKYRVERVLGTGGMGVVVAARHLQLEERVALKFLLPDALEAPEAVARFVQEARAASRIKNDHVARVTDVGQLENGSPYMVMEYLEGADLSTMLAREGAMPVDQAVDYVLQACEALADAHTLGIVHRDLKPANLFCIRRSDGQPFIKVLDFGISKFMTTGPGSGHAMTKTSAIIGSPLYMSPEQLRASKGVDARTDVWSLGVILFELVTGSPPFDAEVSTELILKISSDPAPLLSAYRKDVPAALEPVVARCLAKDREERIQNVGELAQALQAFASRRGLQSVERIVDAMHLAPAIGSATIVTSPGPETKAPAPPRAPARTASSWGHTGRSNRSGRWGRVAVAAGSALVLAVLVVWMIARPSTAPATMGSAAPPMASGPPLSPTTAAPPVTAEPVSAVPPTTATPSAEVVPAPAKPPPTAALPPVTAGTPKHVTPPHTTIPVAPPPGKPNCDPPYTVDSAGHHTYKKECL